MRTSGLLFSLIALSALATPAAAQQSSQEWLDNCRRANRGNNDREDWADTVPEVEELRLGGVGIYLVHDQADIPDDLAERGFRVVVTGHSHKPLVTERAGLLHVNPGSAGPRRFRLPVSVGLLRVDGRRIEAELITLAIDH